MLASYLISVAAKSTVLLAAGLLGVRLLRGRDAAVRHMICLAALAASASVPVLALWPAHWSVLIAIPAGQGVAGGGNSALGGMSWPMALAAIWVLGTLVLLGRAAGGLMLLARIRAGSAHFRNGENAQVRLADVSTPLTCGVLRPLILLPRNAGDWEQLRLRAVLLHESAHVRRRDCVAKYAALSARAMLWWNPLAWMLAERLNREQELACDAEVLAAGVPAQDYATVLLDVVREGSTAVAAACGMAAGKHSAALRERFAHMLAWRRDGRRPSRRIALMIPALLVLLTCVSCAEKIYKFGPGIVPPKVLQKMDPNYTDQARAAKLQGPVVLSLVVGADQRAHDVKVTKSLDPGLDANAVAAIKTWQFQPGTKDGKPVPVRATVQINFKLL